MDCKLEAVGQERSHFETDAAKIFFEGALCSGGIVVLAWLGVNVVAFAVHPGRCTDQLLLANVISEEDHPAQGDVDGAYSSTGHTIEIRVLPPGSVQLDGGYLEFGGLSPAHGGKEERSGGEVLSFHSVGCLQQPR